jgi:nucleotide-binding universal stress UspA family protein
MPGISGLENNTVLFSCPRVTAPACYDSAIEGGLFASATQKNLLFLRCGDSQFGARKRLHVWLTWHDSDNANLMLLLVYILLGHEDWRHAEMRVFAAFPEERVRKEEKEFVDNLAEGRLPIGESNIEFLASDESAAFRALVEKRSADADLVIMGATVDRLRDHGRTLLEKHPELPNVLFVAAFDKVRID